MFKTCHATNQAILLRSFVSSIPSTPVIFVTSISRPLLFLSSTQIGWFGLNAFKVQAVAQQLFNDKISLTA